MAGFLECLESLSCCQVHFWWSFNLLTNLLTLAKHPLEQWRIHSGFFDGDRRSPRVLKQPQTLTFLPPFFTVGIMFIWWNVAFGFHHVSWYCGQIIWCFCLGCREHIVLEVLVFVSRHSWIDVFFLGSKDFLVAYFQCIFVQLSSGRFMPFNISSGEKDLWVRWKYGVPFFSNLVFLLGQSCWNGLAWANWQLFEIFSTYRWFSAQQDDWCSIFGNLLKSLFITHWYL